MQTKANIKVCEQCEGYDMGSCEIHWNDIVHDHQNGIREKKGDSEKHRVLLLDETVNVKFRIPKACPFALEHLMASKATKSPLDH